MLYWTKELEEANWYVFNPQWDPVVDELIALDISPWPDSVMRLWLNIKMQDSKPDLPDLQEPVTAPFERNGFTVVEWGVVLDYE